MAILTQSFFARDTLTVAPALLGRYLVRELPEGRVALRITETEAYVGRMDKASHAYGYRRTARTESLFSRGGVAYVYLIYGMYHCLNFVTERQDEPCGVLIRAGEAVYGEALLARYRFGAEPEELTAYQRKHFLNGPGKLCKALHVTRAQNGLRLPQPELFVCDDPADFGMPDYQPPPAAEIRRSGRVGIDYAEEAIHFPWRFQI